MIHPVILSGGAGTRLWPLSRLQHPKQVLPLVGEGSLLQEAATRMNGVEHVADPLLVCNEEHRFLVDEQMRTAGQSTACVILEPFGRNTAPALTLAALALQDQGDGALLLVMPSDHHIRDHGAFHAAVRQAIPLALDGRLVTFGVHPEAPETGYGYIRRGKGPHEVAAFVEKPDRDTARRLIESGRCLWNSGIFMMDLSVWLKELARHRPEIVAACDRAFRQGTREGRFLHVDREAFGECPSDSIDYAVMEKTGRAAVVQLAAGWTDLGSWSSFWEVSARDDDGNARSGDTFAHGSRNCVLIANGRFLAAVGLDGMVVVETPDAVLAVPREKAQSVREVVGWLESQGRDEHRAHRRVYHSWGQCERIEAGERYEVNRLTIGPGAGFSLHFDDPRSVHWVVVKGAVRVTSGERAATIAAPGSISMPAGKVHRIENPNDTPLEIVEVRAGDRLER